MAIDPVCGMVVEETPDALRFDARGTTYYFCSEGCRLQFAEPERELRRTKRLAALALGMGAVTMALAMLEPFPEPLLGWLLLAIATPAQAVAGRPFYSGIRHAVAHRAANMDTLIAIGATAAWLFSALEVVQPDLLVRGMQQYYFEIALVVIGFILLGRWLEHGMRRKASDAVRKLVAMQPTRARMLRGGEEVEVGVEDVYPDDVLVVRPGERVPLDGKVLEGRSAVDEKMLTGEAMPVDKGPGDEVIGGTINQDGLLKVQVTNIGMNTALAQIVKLVEEAQTASAPIQRLVDRVSAYFVPIVVLVALGSFVAWLLLFSATLPYAFTALVAVLLIACPCALGLATPAALVVGTGKGAEHGILIKGGEFLERVRKVNTVIFDKTGTLTRGKPVLTDAIPLPGSGLDEEGMLRLAAAAERGSEHPLGKAVLQGARERLGAGALPEPQDFHAIAGGGVEARVEGRAVLVGNARLLGEQGVDVADAGETLARLQGEGKTAMLVAVDGRLAGLVAVADEVKPEAQRAVQALRDAGVEVAMLTGDNERTARAVAAQLGIGRVLAEVRPAEKAAEVRKLQEEGRIVAMVGDGVNDAPALAQADIGVAIGSGADVAVEAGDLVLMRSDPRDVAAGIRLSRATLGKVHQNLFWAFFYNVALIPIAASGLLNPMLAGLAMALSSVTVVGNSLLLRRYRMEV